MSERVLVVEDESTLRRSIVRFLRRRGYEVEDAETVEGAQDLFADQPADVLVTDLRLPDGNGLDMAGHLMEKAPDTMTLLMTAYSSVESVIEALRGGVQDYLLKPIILEDLGAKIDKLFKVRRLEQENALLRKRLAELGEDGEAEERMVARSRQMQELLELVARVAPTLSTVLIQGETGSGKEMVARAIHNASNRGEGPFRALNMSAMPEHLVESTLYGHEKGAFTGAAQKRQGLFRAASGGTLFLDEIGDMPLELQGKMLRVLETRTVMPVGSDESVPFDTRILAATHHNLLERVENGKFREDLYYRLAPITLRIPPLRERRDDIPALVHELIRRHSKRTGREVLGIDSASMEHLIAHDWPGNVRELSNVLEHAVVICQGKVITPADLPARMRGSQSVGAPAVQDGFDYKRAMDDFERGLIANVLREVDGDRKAAADRLDISLATLYRRLDKLDLKDLKT